MLPQKSVKGQEIATQGQKAGPNAGVDFPGSGGIQMVRFAFADDGHEPCPDMLKHTLFRAPHVAVATQRQTVAVNTFHTVADENTLGDFRQHNIPYPDTVGLRKHQAVAVMLDEGHHAIAPGNDCAGSTLLGHLGQEDWQEFLIWKKLNRVSWFLLFGFLPKTPQIAVETRKF